jgi:hypothetical protein
MSSTSIPNKLCFMRCVSCKITDLDDNTIKLTEVLIFNEARKCFVRNILPLCKSCRDELT